MSRIHIHINVQDLDQSILFYSTLFGAEPTVIKSEYAKWMLDDPAINFAISDKASVAGINHVGIQTDDRSGLSDISSRLKAAGETTYDQEATSCCYAVSDKTWVEDPSGVRWETFFTKGEGTIYGEEEAEQEMSKALEEERQRRSATPSKTSTAACC